jgi:hypothetical protein
MEDSICFDQIADREEMKNQQSKKPDLAGKMQHCFLALSSKAINDYSHGRSSDLLPYLNGLPENQRSANS